ncbi:GNAT family N-acetyltransferase [Chitinivibrio alkaliphilus]|nr:GNAT family N-acetyltransferase [Chitinivibrio alkaliphilus]
MARQIWTDQYVPIVGQQQVDYMLETYQNKKDLITQLQEGYEYYTIARDERLVGYMALVPKEHMLLLSKIYVARSERGHGLGQKMLAFAEHICQERGIKTIYLRVNKNNTHSIAWYRHSGFEKGRSLIQNIGNGFFMDDYEMEKSIADCSQSHHIFKT